MRSSGLAGSFRGAGVAASLAAGLVLAGTLPGCASPGTTGSPAQEAARTVTASPSPAIGKGYPFRLFIHCGVPIVDFAGRAWQPVPPVPRYPGPAPVNGVTTYTGYVAGTMTLIDSRTLRFTADARAVVSPFSVLFRPSAVRVGGAVCSLSSRGRSRVSAADDAGQPGHQPGLRWLE